MSNRRNQLALELMEDGVNDGAAMAIADEMMELERPRKRQPTAPPKSTLAHHCHAEGCTRATPPKLLMCGYHWHLVPKHLQRGVWTDFRPGQEVDKKPSFAWCRAADAAVEFIARKEGRTVAQTFVSVFHPLAPGA